MDWKRESLVAFLGTLLLDSQRQRCYFAGHKSMEKTRIRNSHVQYNNT